MRCIKASCYVSSRRRSPQVFISYNKANSQAAAQACIVSRHVGAKWADPAQMCLDLENRKGRCAWLDAEHSAYLSREGIYAGKSAALSRCDVVLLCVSDAYAASQVCSAECSHVLDHLGKRAIVCVVGSSEGVGGGKWEDSHLAIAVKGLPLVDFRGSTDEASFIEKMDDVNALVHEVRGSLCGKSRVTIRPL